MNRSLVLLVLLGCNKPADTDPGETDADTDADSDADADTDADADADADRFFPDAAPWYQDISTAAVDGDSPAMIAALQSAGWGFDRFQMDFSLEVLEGDASTPRRTFETSDDFYSPDCDHVDMLVPTSGNLEGETGYQCTTDGDCHLIVTDRDAGKLYEMWRADIDGGTFTGGCLAVWDMNRVYPGEGRGDQCTSADAAGYPIAPLLFTADEVAAGAIEHAIRFALPNDRIRDGEYFHPASHATNAGGGGATALPYGARLRLKADFDMSRIDDPDARVIAVALQKYGMFLADGGNITLMGRSDQRTTAKWEDLLEDFTHALVGIEPDDFEVLDLEGPAIALTYDCVRNGY